jgi:SAM-dependent methyltransferase
MHPILNVHNLSKTFLSSIACQNDIFVDATCGNGYDALFLAELAIRHRGKFYGFDIQQKALENTQQRLPNEVDAKLILDNHANLNLYFAPQSVGIFMYNLGYLPRQDKCITTRKETTIQSLHQALHLLRPLGGIAITCYTGHDAGKEEWIELQKFTKQLDPSKFYVTWTTWSNRLNCPEVILIQKQSTK